MKNIQGLLIIAFCLIWPHLVLGQNKLKVVTSASIFQDMASNIGGDMIDVHTIVPIGGDPHIYESRPSDAALVASADLILVNGFHFEGWINELIENSGTKAPVITITHGINPIASTKYDNAYDPHAWMNAHYGQTYIKNILNALIDLDPDNKEKYESNYKKYADELKALDLYIIDQIKKIPEKQRILITSHDAFAYYGERYGIKVSPIMGVSTDADVQTSDIIRVNKIIKDSQVPAIFIESTINPKLLEQMAKDNKISIGGELFADSIGDEKTEANSYADMLKHNTDVIVKALSQGINTETKLDDDKSSGKIYLYLLIGLIMIGSLLFLIFKANK